MTEFVPTISDAVVVQAARLAGIGEAGGFEAGAQGAADDGNHKGGPCTRQFVLRKDQFVLRANFY
jgi:hypothetical protein